MTAVLDNDWACGAVQIRNRYKQNLRCAAGGLPFYCRSICIYISYFPCVLGRKKGVLYSIYYTHVSIGKGLQCIQQVLL